MNAKQRKDTIDKVERLLSEACEHLYALRDATDEADRSYGEISVTTDRAYEAMITIANLRFDLDKV